VINEETDALCANAVNGEGQTGENERELEAILEAQQNMANSTETAYSIQVMGSKQQAVIARLPKYDGSISPDEFIAAFEK